MDGVCRIIVVCSGSIIFDVVDERDVDMTLRENIEDVAAIVHMLIVFGVPIVLCWWAGVPWHVIIIVVI